MKSKRASAVVAALACFNAAASAGLSAQVVLFDPAAAQTLPATFTDGRGQVRNADGKTWLNIAADRADGQAEALFKPQAAAWDLSASAGLSMTLHNPNAVPMTVRLMASNDDAKGLSNACRFAIELQAGETRDVFMRLTRRPADPTYEPFRPFMMYYKNMNVRDNTIDPTAVAAFSIKVNGKGENGVDVSAITPTGKGTPAGEPFFPFVDAFGQYVHGDWPGKIYADTDFAERVAEEKREREGWPQPESWDKWGGWKDGPTLKATGFFYAAKHDGKWWLVDPDGKLFWSYGPTGVGFGGDVTPVSDRENWFATLPDQKDPAFAPFYKHGRGATYKYYEHREWTGFDIQRANLSRKYGSQYETAVAELSHARLHSWGFNTIGNWSAPTVYGLHKTPYTVAINSPSVSMMRWTADGHSFQDVYDERWEPGIYAEMEKQRGKTAGDPWCLGYFIDNERAIGWQPRAAVVGEMALKAGPKQPAKLKFVDMLKAKYGDVGKLNAAWRSTYGSWDALLTSQEPPALKGNAALMTDCGDLGMAFCERYFSVSRDAVKKVAPNNMFLGSRFYGTIDPAVVAVAGKYWDVISYNIYDNPPDGRVNQYRKLDLPILCTEWGIESDPMQTPFRDEKLTAMLPSERSGKMTGYVEHALRLPNMIGAHFFQFRDQPITGRPDGEATLRGFVNVADTPNFELVQANRRVAYRMYETRSQAK